MTDTPRIQGLGEIAGDYQALLCDVWGVLHNGVAAWPGAIDALSRFRREGGVVVMITNAPRPREPVLAQLSSLGVPAGTFDAVVTSGDVTRNLISKMDRRVFHIGPERDHKLYAGLDVEFVGLDEARTVVCTGLFDDHTETPEDYRELLAQLRERELPFVCANPDIVVEYGDRLLWCAGALARDYRELGGETHIVGKPHEPIYARAVEVLNEHAKAPVERKGILAVGDGMHTDMAGAADFGLDFLYVSAGIHAAEYGDAETPDAVKLEAFLSGNDAAPRAWIPRLRW